MMSRSLFQLIRENRLSEIITHWQDRLMKISATVSWVKKFRYLTWKPKMVSGKNLSDYSRKIKGENETWDSWISLRKRAPVMLRKTD